jgi:hypothetical protein
MVWKIVTIFTHEFLMVVAAKLQWPSRNLNLRL